MDNIKLGNNIIQINSIDSTNTYAQELLQQTSCIPEGTVINAIEQVGGRGQRGKTWESEKGKSLTFSIVVFPDFLKGESQFLISKAVALGIADYLSKTLNPSGGNSNHQMTIKWPNDVYVNGCKISGILIENSITNQSITQSVIGVGINVNQTLFMKKLLNPISMAMVTGLKYDLTTVLSDVLNCIDVRYKTLVSRSFSVLDQDYLKTIFQLGEWCSYQIKGKVVQAKIIGVSKVGKLILENQQGNTLVCDNNEIEYQLG